MLQQVLTIGRAVFHFADDANQFWVQAMYSKVNASALACFHYFIFHLFLHLGNDFFNACRVDTSVCHELVEGQTANFTANGVEGTNDNSLRSIIDNDFCTSGSFQCTDVATFTTYHAAFDFIRINMENTDGILHRCFTGHTLNGLDDDLLCLFIGSHLGFVHDFVDVLLRLGLSLVFQRFNQGLSCLFCGQA